MASQLWLPSFYASGMILQQQVSCALRGRTRPGARVSLTLERSPLDEHALPPLDSQYGVVADLTETSDDQGGFSFELPAFKASFDPFVIKIAEGRHKREFRDILFGEVWIAAGQSNMEMPLSAVVEAGKLSSVTNLHGVRILRQSPGGLPRKKSKYSYNPAEDLSEAQWIYGDQHELAAGVSAVAYSFARELHLDLHVPVGIIETAAGGSQIHSWLDRETIESNLAIKQHILDQGVYRSETDWNVMSDPSWASSQPAALFNHKIAPLNGLGARGILWYQGEGDYQYPAYYQQALPAMILKWSRVFRAADNRGLGFLYVQLAPCYYGHSRFTQLAEFNEILAAIRRNLPGPAGLVTTYDLPPLFDQAPEPYRHPAHPTPKLPIGERLKTIAMGLMYQRKAPSSSPECVDIEMVGSKMLLSFDNIGEGLRLKGEDTRLRGFAICGADRVFVEATARLLYGLRVLVWHDQVAEPKAVTYAFADMNGYANLVSRDHLPVVPFRSDRAPSRYSPPMEWTHCEILEVWSCPSIERIFETGWHPAWMIERGQGEIKVEKANKAEGDGSLRVRYQAPDALGFGLEPLLSHDSMFPPLDLSYFSQLSIDVFNAEQHMKHMRLALAFGSPDSPLSMLGDRAAILPALRWQTLRFDLRNLDESGLAAVRRVVFVIEDPKGKGSLYLDQVRLVHES